MQTVVITWGLRVWIALQLVSAPLAWRAHDKWRLFAASRMPEDESNFDFAAAFYYFVQAAAEAAMVAAGIASAVWLYRTWSHIQARLPEPSLSPRQVVAWTLVPLWGFWRLHGFILDLAGVNEQTDSDIRVGRWWWTTLAFFLFGALAKSRRIPGLGHITYDVLGAIVGLLSLKLFDTLHGALVAEERS
jgi:hypothetical protein